MQMRTLVGEPRAVPLPVLDQAYYAGDRHVRVPDAVTPELAELVGYFMGDGSLHAKGIRLCVANTDLDVAERLGVLAKGLFGLEPVVTAQEGYQELTLSSVRLARWWQAAGFAKALPDADHTGKGWVPRVPSAILEANDPVVYGAFLRGLFEADGTVLDGVPSLSTAHESFAAEVRTLLLAQGLAATTSVKRSAAGAAPSSRSGSVTSITHSTSASSSASSASARTAWSPSWNRAIGRKDYVFLPRRMGRTRSGGHPPATRSCCPCASAAEFRACSPAHLRGDPRRQAGQALGYLFERVAANEDGGVQPTYDLSVPENVTYVANGMVSHNTIGLMMDCDTTGIEPDLALVKFKKLVGGGSMQIVNQTVPRALKNLGYPHEQVEAITEYIAEHGHVVNAPGLRPEHYEVFDCAMGERSISPMGHVRMMAAVQPTCPAP